MTFHFSMWVNRTFIVVLSWFRHINLSCSRCGMYESFMCYLRGNPRLYMWL